MTTNQTWQPMDDPVAEAELDAFVFGVGAVFVGHDGEIRHLGIKEIYDILDNHHKNDVESTK